MRTSPDSRRSVNEPGDRGLSVIPGRIARTGVRDFLSSTRDYELVGEAGSAREAFTLIESQRPDVVLMGRCTTPSTPASSDSSSRPIRSTREREIFRLAANCSTTTEMAKALCLARKTVDTHLNTINRKLGIRGRAQRVRLAVSIGLVHAVRTRSPESRSQNARLLGVSPHSLH